MCALYVFFVSFREIYEESFGCICVNMVKALLVLGRGACGERAFYKRMEEIHGSIDCREFEEVWGF
jgi:hypothetical protein